MGAALLSMYGLTLFAQSYFANAWCLLVCFSSNAYNDCCRQPLGQGQGRGSCQVKPYCSLGLAVYADNHGVMLGKAFQTQCRGTVCLHLVTELSAGATPVNAFVAAVPTLLGGEEVVTL